MITIDCPIFEEYVKNNPHIDINQLLISVVTIDKEISKNKDNTISGTEVLSQFINHYNLVESKRFSDINNMFSQQSKDMVNIWKEQNNNNTEETLENVITGLMNKWKEQNNNNTKETIESAVTDILQVISKDDTVSPFSNALKENKEVMTILKYKLDCLLEKNDKSTESTNDILKDFVKYMLPYKATSNGNAGTLMENKFEELLCEHLEDGYAVENVSKGSGHKGDLRVSYTDRNGNAGGKCPILLELKFWKTKPVDTDNVVKFHRDIIEKNTHGIMISTDSNICNKHNLQFEILPNTHLIALYLTKVGDDIERVKQAMDFIYILDDFLVKQKSDVIPLTTKVIRNLITILEEDESLINEIQGHNEICKKHMDESIRKIKKIKMNKIKDVLIASLTPKEIDSLSSASDEDNVEPENTDGALFKKCRFCKKTYKNSKQGLSNHKNKLCKSIPDKYRSRSIEEIFKDTDEAPV